MYIKTRTDLRADLIKSYTDLVDLDIETEGTSERDIFVEAPIEGQLLDIWNGLDYLQKLQSPLLYENDLLDSDKDKFCRNYNVGDISATYATGEVILYTEVKPIVDIYVDSSYQVSTDDSSVTFKIVGFYTIPVELADNYYNSITNRYELSVRVVALTAGVSGNVATYKITKLVQPITGIAGCINNSPTSDGEPAGTISQRMALVKEKQKGRNLANMQGIKNFVGNYVTSLSVVGSNDALMVRSEGLGSCIDIYVKGSELSGYTDTFVVTSTGLTSLSSQYTDNSITLTMQPVSSIAIFLKNSVPISTTYYSLTKDTGILKNSTRASDRLVLTSTGLTNLGYFDVGDSLEVRYNYNSLLHKIEDTLNEPANQYDNRDYLLYEQTPIYILVYAKVKLYTGYDIPTVTNSFSVAYASFLDAFTGSSIELADVIGIIKNTAGVDNIDLPTAYINASDNRTKTTSGDIPIYDREYPEPSTINLVAWTY